MFQLQRQTFSTVLQLIQLCFNDFFSLFSIASAIAFSCLQHSHAFSAGNAFFFQLFFIFRTLFRFATSPATRRVAGHIIYQNVRLDRDRCAITFLNSVRIFRDVCREKLRKILHVSQWDGRKKKSEKDQSLEFNKRLLLRHTFTQRLHLNFKQQTQVLCIVVLLHVLIGHIVFDQSLINDHDHFWRNYEIIMGVYWTECSCQSA